MSWQNSPVNGLLLIDKSVGFTSFDVCAVVRGMLRTKKVGHSGTLDPMATGVLPILVGSATRALDLIPSHDKIYVAEFKLGVRTDTLDVTGKILSESEADIEESLLKNVIQKFSGNIMQIPPMYSAVSVNGKKLYDLARQGVEIEREARQVTIYSISLNEYNRESGTGKITVSCSKGTYIRTLIDDIGVQLGCGAVLTSLRRTMASGFAIDKCMTIQKAQEYKDAGILEEHILPVDTIFECYPELCISDNQTIRFNNGAALGLDRLHPPVINGVRQAERLTSNAYKDKSLYRVYSRTKVFLGLGIKDGDELKVFKRF